MRITAPNLPEAKMTAESPIRRRPTQPRGRPRHRDAAARHQPIARGGSGAAPRRRRGSGPALAGGRRGHPPDERLRRRAWLAAGEIPPVLMGGIRAIHALGSRNPGRRRAVQAARTLRDPRGDPPPRARARVAGAALPQSGFRDAGSRRILATQLLAALPRAELGAPIGSLAAERAVIRSTLDMLFLGF